MGTGLVIAGLSRRDRLKVAVSGLLFHHRRPRPPLDAFVEILWLFRQAPRPYALERVLPTGAAQLIVNLKEDRTRVYDPARPGRYESTAGSVLVGPRSVFSVIDTDEQEHVAGVAFRPGGTAGFLPMPASETRGEEVPLEAIWGRAWAARLRERMLDSRTPDGALDVLETALRELFRPPGLHRATAFALSVFDRTPQTVRIAEVTRTIGLSAKRFIERFTADVGLTPKRYCRLRRFQGAVAAAHRAPRVNWAEVALDSGYYDQAHFIHDFRAFSGLTPTAYHAARTGFQNHVKFLQEDSAAP